MLRFIHTADWQIGRVFSQFEEDDAEALAAARFTVIERIAALAEREQADVVLVAGDVFDAQGVRDKTIRRMFLAMAAFSGPWVMIPGNHDAALAESVWTRARRIGAVPDNVVLALSPATVVLEGKCAVLPAPLTQRHTYNDLTEWFAQAETPAGLPRVGLAHGSVQGILAEEVDSTNPIASDRCSSARLDYLALGDWHGTRSINERCWYAGTPEQDRFKDNGAGNALVVELDGQGALPRVKVERVGSFEWLAAEFALAGASDVDEVFQSLTQLQANQVAQFRLAGTADLAGHERLRVAAQAASAKARALLWDDTALKLAPTDDDLAALHADGYVGETLAQLRVAQQSSAQTEMQAAPDDIARDALLELARILADGSAARGDQGAVRLAATANNTFKGLE